MKLLQAGARAPGFSTQLWTLRRFGRMVEVEFSRRYSESQVWRVLGSLGFGSQPLAGRARERDEAALRRWQRVRRLELKTMAGTSVTVATVRAPGRSY